MSVPEYTKKCWRDWYNRNKDNEEFKQKMAIKNAKYYKNRKEKKLEQSKITVIKVDENNKPNMGVVREDNPNNDTILEDNPNNNTILEDKPNMGVILEDKPNNDTILEDKPNIDINNSIFMNDIRTCTNDLTQIFGNTKVCYECAIEGATIDCVCYGKYKYKKTIKNNKSINNILTKKQSKKPTFFSIDENRKFIKETEENIRKYNEKRYLRAKNNV
jgi:hypothetical protein